MTMHIDPRPDLYPHCMCNGDCEFPCWQRVGIDQDFDPDSESGCCCKRRKHITDRSQPLDAEHHPRLTIDRWYMERRQRG